MTAMALVAPGSMAAAGGTPTPSTAGVPDFSGVWTLYVEPGQSPLAGFAMETPDLPLTAEGKRRREEYLKLVKADVSPLGGDNPGAHCVQYGMPGMMQQAGAYPIEFIQRPEQITIIYEVEGETRRVYMPGRTIPPEERLAVRQGYSEGRWDGDTLVVETTDMNDGIDQFTYSHSDQAKIVERFRLADDSKTGKVIDYEMTMTDPVYYTQPVSFKKRWMPLPNGRIMAYNCTEEPWLRLLDARRKQLQAGKPISATMKDVIEVYEDGH